MPERRVLRGNQYYPRRPDARRTKTEPEWSAMLTFLWARHPAPCYRPVMLYHNSVPNLVTLRYPSTAQDYCALCETCPENTMMFHALRKIIARSVKHAQSAGCFTVGSCSSAELRFSRAAERPCGIPGGCVWGYCLMFRYRHWRQWCSKHHSSFPQARSHLRGDARHLGLPYQRRFTPCVVGPTVAHQGQRHGAGLQRNCSRRHQDHGGGGTR